VSHFDDLGGEDELRAIIDEFVDRLFDDAMIGFFFANASRERIKKFEYQHAAEHLGAGVVYEGRPLAVAHRAHRIMGGQFLRRKEILRQTLVKHEVKKHVIDAWLAHVESLRPLITSDPGGECIEH
jgi:hemoglobin